GGDLAKPEPMNRLLQGDVGSGKTVVALFAALVAVANGRQAAIMAPTEILASQHHDRIAQYLAGSRVRFALLTGSLSAGERKRIHGQLAEGELDLVVGTSALVSEGVRFARLGLAVIDEQHKFGVRQRAELRETKSVAKGGGVADPLFSRNAEGVRSGVPNTFPHLLVMTATPIPRSLALTVFGDLAVSIIDELPPGRGRTETRVVTEANRNAALDFVGARLARGGQAFFVCPRIGATEDESPRSPGDEEREETISAEQAYRELQPRFEKHGVALVHGQMPRERQRDVLAAFAAGRVRVLVATTVVEVGVDIARADVMGVLAAECFGLAQLHQLRGRIGRSADIARSYCLLFVSKDSDAGRLDIMERTRDGFRIAEEDLARRGPGQFFGVAQHGLPEFVHVDLAKDLNLLREARKDAFAGVQADPTLAAPGHVQLRRHMQAAYGGALGLIDAG
ncbi:MAG: helicase-related protein, partial [Phycisphaerae bacterium]|nr:helicase-related protein [Phycisphaerae bacterium]